MKILLHIGWPKTGSTAIQHFLAANRDVLLTNHHILYPKTGIVMNAHYALSSSLQDPTKKTRWVSEVGFNEQAEPLFAKVFEEAKRCSAKAIILSSEQFTNTNLFSIEQLAGLLAGHEVQLIVYLRRQDEYIESFYNQCVKDHLVRHSVGFDTFSQGDGNLTYYEYLMDWEKRFPGITINMRIYDRNRFPDKDVVRDFLTAISVTHNRSFIFQKRDVNPSLSSISIKTLAKINQRLYLNHDKYFSVIKYLKELDTKDGDRSQTFFLLADRLACLKQFEESNDRLFQKYGDGKNIFKLTDTEAKSFSNADLKFDAQIMDQRVRDRVKQVLSEIHASALFLPTWKSLEGLSHCLDTLQSHLYRNLNIIIVSDNNHNPDLRELLVNYPNVSLYQIQPPLNCAETINNLATEWASDSECSFFLGSSALSRINLGLIEKISNWKIIKFMRYIRGYLSKKRQTS